MILKSYEINKIDQNISHLILFYGKNEGLKNEAVRILVKKNDISNYEEREMLDNETNFLSFSKKDLNFDFFSKLSAFKIIVVS